VQFAHFRFTREQVAKFREPKTEITVAISYPHYNHMAVMSQAVKEEMIKDFE